MRTRQQTAHLRNQQAAARVRNRHVKLFDMLRLTGIASGIRAGHTSDNTQAPRARRLLYIHEHPPGSS
jgi:hypothetical protein